MTSETRDWHIADIDHEARYLAMACAKLRNTTVGQWLGKAIRERAIKEFILFVTTSREEKDEQ